MKRRGMLCLLLLGLLAGCGRNTAPGGAPGSAQASLPGSAAGRPLPGAKEDGGQ